MSITILTGKAIFRIEAGKWNSLFVNFYVQYYLTWPVMLNHRCLDLNFLQLYFEISCKRPTGCWQYHIVDFKNNTICLPLIWESLNFFKGVLTNPRQREMFALHFMMNNFKQIPRFPKLNERVKHFNKRFFYFSPTTSLLHTCAGRCSQTWASCL